MLQQHQMNNVEVLSVLKIVFCTLTDEFSVYAISVQALGKLILCM